MMRVAACAVATPNDPADDRKNTTRAFFDVDPVGCATACHCADHPPRSFSRIGSASAMMKPESTDGQVASGEAKSAT